MQEFANEIGDRIGDVIALLLVPLLLGALASGVAAMINGAMGGEDTFWRIRDSGTRPAWMVIFGFGDPARYHGGWLIVCVKWICVGIGMRLMWRVLAG